MMGILDALREGQFTCYGPANVNDFAAISLLDNLDVPNRRSKTIEKPAPIKQFVPIRLIDDEDQLLFKFFIDGSERATNAGFVVDSKKRYLPLIIAQIGVATTELHNSHIDVKQYDENVTLFFPDSFSEEDRDYAKKAVCDAALTSRQPLNLEFDLYEVDDTDGRNPVDSARARILSKMHTMEIKRIVSLAKENEISRDSLLLIDGSIEFYHDMERHKEAFRNVVGVAKTFDLYKTIRAGRDTESTGNLISRLPPAHRTPAVGTKHRNLTIASWYLRLHDRRRMTSLDYPDGVVKIEIFPDDPADASPSLDSSRCDRISKHILALRAPATPSTDPRWASHLYPVHLTERYIKTQFRNEKSILACL